MRCVTGDGEADLGRANGAALCLDADDPLSVAQEARHFALLDDVDAEAVGGAGITPGDRVVAGGAGAGLEDGALHGKAGTVRVV